jgi:hypothetical protein
MNEGKSRRYIESTDIQASEVSSIAQEATIPLPDRQPRVRTQHGTYGTDKNELEARIF